MVGRCIRSSLPRKDLGSPPRFPRPSDTSTLPAAVARADHGRQPVSVGRLVSYRITVFFTTTAATTVDSARTEIEVKAGETIKWSAKQEFTASKEMLCVLRGVDAA